VAARRCPCHRAILPDDNVEAVVGVGGCRDGPSFGAVYASGRAAAARRACLDVFRVPGHLCACGVPSAAWRDPPSRSPDASLVDRLPAFFSKRGHSMLVAASVFAKADAYGWGRLRRVLFRAFVFIGSLAFSEGSTVSFVQRLSGHVAFTMREVRARWRHGYAEGDAFPAPPDLGNLGPALRNDAATSEESLAVSFLFVSHLLHSVETVTKILSKRQSQWECNTKSKIQTCPIPSS